jgi:hypothetical protein
MHRLASGRTTAELWWASEAVRSQLAAGKNDFGQWQFCRDLDGVGALRAGGPGARGHEILEGWNPKEFTRVR